MKKRLISVLLTVCLVAALFSGLTVSASAADTITYTLKSGDTVYGVCQSLGIDFYANYDWITKTNNITNYANLKPGTVITLPAAGTKPDNITGNTPVAGSSNDKNLLEGDFISGYLVPHVMKAGETVYDLCIAMGVDFHSNSDRIMKLNNIKSFNRIGVGSTILLPTTKAPESGSCIKIVAHKIVAGDATYNICQSYGIDYKSNLNMLKALNNKDNLGVIKTGQILYLPVPTVIQAGGGNNGGTGGSGGNSGSGNNGGNNGGNSGTTTPDGQSYTIYTNTTNHGSFEVLVGGKAATQAKSGTAVTVKASPAEGYQLGSISVTKDGKEVASVSNGSFTMPSCNVRISVSFVSAISYSVYRGDAVNGTFKTQVNGTTVDKAAAGQTVNVLASPAYGYELNKITVYRAGTSTTVPVNNGSFVMPADAVKVEVSFKAAVKHSLNKAAATGGSFDMQINGTSVSSADSGETVKVVATPNAGYKLDSISVTRDSNGAAVSVNNGSFIMPEDNVTVKVSFAVDRYTVYTDDAANGKFSVLVNGKDTSSAVYGDTVTVKTTPAEGYVVDSIKVTKDGKEVATVGADGTFKMPAQNVRVTVTFKAAVYTVYTDNAVNGSFTILVNGKESTSASAGDTVTVKTTPDKDCELVAIKVTNGGAEAASVGADGTFRMPAQNVRVTVTFKGIGT